MKSRFKIAHFIHFDGRGGGPVVASQLAEGLSEDYEQVVFLSGKGKFHSTCERLRIPLIEVSTHTLASSVFSIPTLARELNRHKVDLLILHGQWAGPIGAMAARLARTPHSIYIAHCPAFYHSTSLMRAIRNYIAEKLPCQNASRTVALSDGNYYNYLFRGWVPESRLVKIHNGVEVGEYPDETHRLACRQQLGWDSSSRHAVFMGRLDDQKRPDWLLEAWAIVQKKRNTQWHLWIAGDGREKEECEALSRRLGIADQVHFLGEQPDGQLWLGGADLVVMTSLYEGHALVPLEAMAQGRPIAAFSVDGITDSVIHEKTGLLCELGDIATLASNIDYLLSNDSVRNKYGRNGYTLVSEKFPLSQTVAHYRTLIRELLDGQSDQKAHLVSHQ